MPLIEDINKRRYALEKRRFGDERRKAEQGDNGFSVTLPDVSIYKPTLPAHRELVVRVNRALALEFAAQRSGWPVETTLSSKSFRGAAEGLTNTRTYAPYVEDRLNPSTYERHPARVYAGQRWNDIARKDIERQIRFIDAQSDA